MLWGEPERPGRSAALEEGGLETLEVLQRVHAEPEPLVLVGEKLIIGNQRRNGSSTRWNKYGGRTDRQAATLPCRLHSSTSSGKAALAKMSP